MWRQDESHRWTFINQRGEFPSSRYDSLHYFDQPIDDPLFRRREGTSLAMNGRDFELFEMRFWEDGLNGIGSLIDDPVREEMRSI